MLNVDDIVGGLWIPDDGVSDTHLFCMSLMREAVENGSYNLSCMNSFKCFILNCYFLFTYCVPNALYGILETSISISYIFLQAELSVSTKVSAYSRTIGMQLDAEVVHYSRVSVTREHKGCIYTFVPTPVAYIHELL